jgi:hypothetical protein
MAHDKEIHVFHTTISRAIGVLLAACPAFVFGQAKPAPQYFVVCASQMNEPTIYFSGVLQGPATTFPSIRADFSQFLTQHYAYKGAVVCAPTNTAANAQNFIAARSTALRNAKKSVVDTGWTEGAAGLAPAASALTGVQRTMPQVKAAAGAASNAAAPTGSTSAATTGGAGSPAQMTSVLGAIFGASGGTNTGTGTATSTGGNGDSATPGKAGQAKVGAAPGGSTSANGMSASGTSGAGPQSPFQQVSSALTSVFGAKSASGSASADVAPKGAPSSTPDGSLGTAQAQNTKLIVYGCGRQDTKVACVTDLTNQNQKNTLIQAGDVWKDAFIVDDRGDRHQRTSGFFLNVDGDQRPQLDISYGKSARFVLMFDGVPTKVQKVALRSAADGLDVEEINLLGASAGTKASQ